MNRAELVDAVAERCAMDKRQAKEAVSAVLETLMSEAKAGNRSSISGFGTFNVADRPARTGRNPQTGQPVKIAASKAVRFSPAQAFKDLLNAKPGKKAAGKKAAPARAASKASGTTKKTAAKSAAGTKKAATKSTGAAKKATKSTKKR